MRILVLGCSGSGKSTLSRSLGQTLDIPVFHMDKLFWKENWVESSDEELAEKLEEIVALKDWIIDGNFSRFLPHRLERTEEIIYINLPRWQNLWRVTKRYLQYRGQTRPDMGDGCNEKLDLEFLLWIWNFPKRSHHKMIQLMMESKKPTTILHSQKAIDGFFQDRVSGGK